MVLGIDTSGGVCSVAIINESKLICEFSINHKKTHSAMLIPMLQSMMEKSDIDIADVSLVAVACGPGSFTGLRIGAATAKGISLSLNIPIVGVPTLDALSYNLRNCKGLICPIMDARRNEVYTAVYDYGVKGIETIDSPIVEPSALPISDLLKKISSLVTTDSKVIFLGDGVPVYSETIKEKADFPFDFAADNVSLQRASSVALLGEKMAKEKAGSSDSLKLMYLRRPQAERERLGL